MCFVINKDYAGEIEIGMTNVSDASGLVESPAEIADLVAVQDSGVRNVTNIGHGSAVVETAMTPQALGD
jgi:dUTPase